ncbi:MAG: fumarylacetoacetate hydrolase family protein [Proteobacteria bacterium]|nr:fumarylacetoacetate hydrolase family protein [Pseudomonadota bacterium]
MVAFSILNYDSDGGGGGPRPGILVDRTVLDIAGALEIQGETELPAESTLALLARWDDALPVFEAIADGFADDPGGPLKRCARPVKDVTLLAPLLYPGTIFCIARNYADHAKEMSGKPLADKQTSAPTFFTKTPAQTVVGTGAPVHLPSTSARIDWEAELAVIIGKPVFKAKVEDAMEAVAGFTIMLDLSIRGPTEAEATTPALKRFRADRFRRKNFDGSAPLGPWLTPAHLVKDVYDQSIKLWVNDELMQDGNSGDMHFTIEEQIAYLSQQLTLMPGDVIATGTPAGVGRPRGIFLEPGDGVTATIGDLGSLDITIEAPK